MLHKLQTYASFVRFSHSVFALPFAYLAALTHRGLIEPASFAAWEAVLAVARMSEPVQTSDLVALWRAWRATHPAASVDA